MSILRTIDGHDVKVDPEDLPWLRKYSWYVKSFSGGYNQYARTSIGPRTIRQNLVMHRLVMGLASRMTGKSLSKLQVDHVNGDGLDNRKINLRVVTGYQNHVHQVHVKKDKVGLSRFKGVVWDAPRGKWAASIGIGRRKYFLGRFIDEKDAARAYDAAALKQWGQYSHLNLP